jgi:hypothetical protein
MTEQKIYDVIGKDFSRISYINDFGLDPTDFGMNQTQISKIGTKGELIFYVRTENELSSREFV